MKTTKKLIFKLHKLWQAWNSLVKLAPALAAIVLLTSCGRSGGSESRLGARPQTITWFRGNLAVINQDGSVSVVHLYTQDSKGNFPAQPGIPVRGFKVDGIQRITNVTNAISFSGDSPLVRSADGNWWELELGYLEASQTPIKPQNHVVEVAEGYSAPFTGLLVWIRQPDGTVFLSQGGYNAEEKPGPKLDGIQRLYARMQQSMHLTMLRNDGTVWVDTNYFIGSITSREDACATQVAGLDHVQDFDEFTPYAYSDTGVALKQDGSIVYWGIPAIGETEENGLPSPDKPEIKQLAAPFHAVKVIAGPSCGVAIDQDGHVWVWGEFTDLKNTYWPLLRGKVLPTDSTATDKVFEIDGLNNIVDVQLVGSGSDVEALALARDGSVWVWSSTVVPQKIYDGARVP